MSDVDILLETVKKDRMESKVWGGLAVLAGIGGILFATFAGSKDGQLGFLGVLAVGYGIVKILLGLRRPENDRAYLLMTKTPERIVWGYTREVRKQGSNTLVKRVIVLGVEDGKTVELPAPSEQDEAHALKFLAEIAPHATLGFAHERQAQFRKDPASLRVA